MREVPRSKTHAPFELTSQTSRPASTTTPSTIAGQLIDSAPEDGLDMALLDLATPTDELLDPAKRALPRTTIN